MIDEVLNFNEVKPKAERYFGMVFCKKHYIMVAFDIKYKAGDRDEYEAFGNCDDIAAKIQQELSLKFDDPKVIHFEGMHFIALLGINNLKRRDILLDQIKSVAANLKGGMLPAFTATAFVSGPYSEMQECRLAYREIRQCRLYKNVMSNEPVTDTENFKYNNNTYFPLDLMDEFTNYLVRGSKEECKNIIDNIIATNLERKVSHIKFINLMNTIFDHILNSVPFWKEDAREDLFMEKKYLE